MMNIIQVKVTQAPYTFRAWKLQSSEHLPCILPYSSPNSEFVLKKHSIIRLVIYTVEFASELWCRIIVEFYVAKLLIRCRNFQSNVDRIRVPTEFRQQMTNLILCSGLKSSINKKKFASLEHSSDGGRGIRTHGPFAPQALELDALQMSY